MSQHHPSCSRTDAHVHPYTGLLNVHGYVVFFDAEVVISAERLVAERLAELINAHGLADVPDCIPDDVLWGPPGADERIIDLRLPEDPRQRGLEA